MAISYFPQVYPGELLYSVLARYHRHMGAPSSIQSMEALFGRRLVVASLDLPGYLQALAERMPPDGHLNADRVIDEMTLWPYYAAFQSQGLRDYARDAMKLGQTDGLLLKLGMATFRPGRVTKLRFCASCIQEMLGQYGEAYWRRDHQLPGVLVCPDHARPLQDSLVSLKERSRHAFVPPTEKNCPWQAKALVQDGSARRLLILQRLARASRALMDSPGPARTRQGWTTFYREGIRSAGLAYSADRMDQRRLEEEFHRHHGEILGLMPNVMSGTELTGEWLAQMVRKHRKSFHPLHHLLLQDFLDHHGVRQAPFGDGPWFCRNPLSDHRGLPTIKVVTQHRNRGNFVGVFACDCGYVYTRCYFPATGKAGEPRFQAYGPLVAPELRKLVRKQCSLRAISRRLLLDPKTIIKLLDELGITTSWTARKGATLGSTTAAKLAQGKVPTPSDPVRPQHQCKPRLDWSELDVQLCGHIRLAVRQIRQQVPPVRVTILRVERSLKGRGWFSKRATKLLKVMSCLEAETESIAAFQQRRVMWVIEQMDLANEPLRVWRILRRAGLTTRNARMVNQVLACYFGRGQVAA